jgi:hypothetical protein
MKSTRGFHPRRNVKVKNLARHGRSGCSTESALPATTTIRAAVLLRMMEMGSADQDAFVSQHLRQCPRRWQEGDQLETPLRDALTHQALLWVASKCMGSRLHTVLFAPGEEPF